MKKIFLNIISVVTFISLTFTSFGMYANETDDKLFEEVTEKFAINEIYNGGGLNQHFMIENPENYGSEFNPALFVDDEVYEASYNELINSLAEIDINKLSKENQYRYKNLQNALENNLAIGDSIMYENLSANGGEQVNLILMLSLYKFNNIDDVNEYFSLLENVPAYIDNILEYQDKRYTTGYFMSEENAAGVVKFCETFINSGEKNPLITSFTDRLDEWSIDDTEFANDLIEKNTNLIHNSVIPAYQKMAATISLCSGNYDFNPLGKHPGGDVFFENLAQVRIGTDLTIPEIEELLLKETDTLVKQLTAYQNNPVFAKKFYDIYDNPAFESTDLKEMTDWLIEQTAKDKNYPTLKNVKYSIVDLDPFFRDYMNPAFMIIPPVDNSEDIRVYMNGSGDLATTAHETFPGHALQTLYYSRNNSGLLIDRVLQTSGFAEGWAQYAEQTLYTYLYEDEDVINYINANAKYTIYQAALTDIYINYYGWTPEAVTEKIGDIFGPGYYDYVANSPCSYLVYGASQMLINKMQAEAMEKLGADFDLNGFNEFLLDNAHLDFSLIYNRFNSEYLGLNENPETTTMSTTTSPVTSVVATTSSAKTTTTRKETSVTSVSSSVTVKPTTTVRGIERYDTSPKTGDDTILVICTVSTILLLVGCGLFLLHIKKYDDK